MIKKELQVHKACTQRNDYNGKAELSKANDSKKSPTEEDEVSPHTRDQSIKEPNNFTHKTFNILESWIVSLPPYGPHQTRWNHVPHPQRSLSKLIPPPKKKLHYSFRKHPNYAKRSNIKTP